MRVAKVIVPIACFNAEQIGAATFVFRTIRVGFPTAEIVVAINNTAPELRAAIIEGAKGCGIEAVYDDTFATRPLFDIYEAYLKGEQQPFFFCDSDIIFWESIEARVREFGRACMAGRFIPQFYDRFTNAITLARVHSCLVYVDPYRARREIAQYYETLPPESIWTKRPDLVRPLLISRREKNRDGYFVRKTYFYDVWAMAYHALPGVTQFSEELDACFDHLNCGTVAAAIGPAYGVDLVERHRRAMQNPETMRGAWRRQRAHYESARVQED